LTITLVQIQPGGKQRIHSHGPEQVYYILNGRGRMTVAGETREVQAGDCVFIPSGMPHGLENLTGVVLEYLSAAAPKFDGKDLEAMWPLPSETEESAGKGGGARAQGVSDSHPDDRV
jgi:mannose-6-phosphate isomerase-like protein (cupin superfamily)